MVGGEKKFLIVMGGGLKVSQALRSHPPKMNDPEKDRVPHIISWFEEESGTTWVKGGI